MELNGTRKGQRLTVKLHGELDHHNAERVRKALDALIADASIRELCLDLSAVTFMDSAGLGIVLGRYRNIHSRGGKVTLQGVPECVDRIFKMSGVYALIEKK